MKCKQHKPTNVGQMALERQPGQFNSGAVDYIYHSLWVQKCLQSKGACGATGGMSVDDGRGGGVCVMEVVGGGAWVMSGSRGSQGVELERSRVEGWTRGVERIMLYERHLQEPKIKKSIDNKSHR